ncbi:MAG: alpha/beta hydrolase [Bacteroidia bacterium]
MFCKKFSFWVLILSIHLNVFSQNEIEIKIPSVPDSLYGSLLKSKSKYLCIIHSGSGPTDRNGNNEYGGENNSLKKLADSLFARGISTFRYDKRGVGKSKDALYSEDSLRIQDYVKDVLLVMDFFSKKPFNYKEFVLIGHSEGALIVTLAAQKDKRIKKLVLISGAGYRADTIIKRQMSFLAENAKKVIFPMIDTLAAGRRIENVPPILSMLFRESVQNYMISWLPIDPAEELSKVHQRVLILQGDNDIQISVKDAERLKDFNKGADLRIIPKMNHILVDAPEDKKGNRETYNQPDLPLSKDIVPSIFDFLKK